ncbi:CBS domain-containing protein [Sphingobacterium sp. MYb382]|uniref:CBS domain-containing protein n=1 Tax=Sphingobacterium sp. MYb382 TaxID=2745278 RepID=UPI00309C55B3
MKQRVPVSEIMAKKLITVPSTSKISEIYQLFIDHNIRHIPVTDGTHLLGIISKNDILKIGYSFLETNPEAIYAIYDSYNLQDVMVKKPIVVSPTTSIKEVVELLTKESFHSLPVVEEGNLVGIVTSTDLLKYLLQQY